MRDFVAAAAERNRAVWHHDDLTIDLSKMESERRANSRALWWQSHLSKDDAFNAAMTFAVFGVAVPVVFAPAWYLSGSLGAAGLAYAVVVVPLLVLQIRINHPKYRNAIETITALDAQIPEARKAIRGYKPRLDAARSNFNRVKTRRRAIESAIAAKSSQIRAEQEQKADKVLAADWRSMRGVEFEDFVQRVLELQGWKVDTTKTSGDQGADLIATKNSTKVAIQVKGYADTVSNAAVQQALAGKVFYSCSNCATITNSKFSPSAQALAKTARCTLIDGSQISDLAAGKVSIV